MQENVNTAKSNQDADTSRFSKRIGSIVYEVEIHFNPDAREELHDKILRLIRRDMEAAS